MKIAVVGPIPRDTIITHKDETIYKYGCVSHPSIALSKLIEENGEVIPVAHVHQSDYQATLEVFAPYSNINTNFISDAYDQGTVVELNFIDQNNRIEKQQSNMHPIEPKDIESIDAEVFVCVPITDYEVPKHTLKAMKAKGSKVIFDAHGPTSYVDDQGNRHRCHWEDMEQWLPYIDVLKMNLEESLYCHFDSSAPIDYDSEDRSHLDDFAQKVLSHGVEYLYVTLDSDGCNLYEKQKDGSIKTTFIPSYEVQDVIDTTGCGDSFAGGLAFGFAAASDPVIAGQYANILGAMRTQGKTFEVFKSKSDTDQMIADYYNS
jgi:adenosine kinase